MNELLLIVIGSVLVNNFVMSQFLGICPFLGVSKKRKPPLAWAWPSPSSWRWPL